MRTSRSSAEDVCPEPTPCAVGLAERGPCGLAPDLARNVVTVPVSRYAHAHLGTLPPDHLPPSLVPPPLRLPWWALSWGRGTRTRPGG